MLAKVVSTDGGVLKISFFVAGRAAPGGSKRPMHNKAGKVFLVDMGKGNAKWKKEVAKQAREAYSGPPLTGPLEAEFCFIRERGKTVKREYPTVAPDVTKLVRAAEDACKGILWVDDSQIVHQTATKDYGPEPGVWITVWAKE